MAEENLELLNYIKNFIVKGPQGTSESIEKVKKIWEMVKNEDIFSKNHEIDEEIEKIHLLLIPAIISLEWSSSMPDNGRSFAIKESIKFAEIFFKLADNYKFSLPSQIEKKNVENLNIKNNFTDPSEARVLTIKLRKYKDLVYKNASKLRIILESNNLMERLEKYINDEKYEYINDWKKILESLWISIYLDQKLLENESLMYNLKLDQDILPTYGGINTNYKTGKLDLIEKLKILNPYQPKKQAVHDMFYRKPIIAKKAASDDTFIENILKNNNIKKETENKKSHENENIKELEDNEIERVRKWDDFKEENKYRSGNIQANIS